MWNANIERLKAIKAQNLPNAGTSWRDQRSHEDPLFWDYLTKLANALRTTTADEKYHFIDDHRIRLLDEDQISPTDLEKASESLESIIVCRRMFDNGTYKKSMDEKYHYGPCHPLAWIFPGPYTWSECQCKNPLYIEDGRVHLTTCATGINLEKSDQSRLAQGEVIVQRAEHPVLGYTDIEETYALPVDLFVKSVLDG